MSHFWVAVFCYPGILAPAYSFCIDDDIRASKEEQQWQDEHLGISFYPDTFFSIADTHFWNITTIVSYWYFGGRLSSISLGYCYLYHYQRPTDRHSLHITAHMGNKPHCYLHTPPSHPPKPLLTTAGSIASPHQASMPGPPRCDLSCERCVLIPGQPTHLLLTSPTQLQHDGIKDYRLCHHTHLRLLVPYPRLQKYHSLARPAYLLITAGALAGWLLTLGFGPRPMVSCLRVPVSDPSLCVCVCVVSGVCRPCGPLVSEAAPPRSWPLWSVCVFGPLGLPLVPWWPPAAPALDQQTPTPKPGTFCLPTAASIWA